MLAPEPSLPNLIYDNMGNHRPIEELSELSPLLPPSPASDPNTHQRSRWWQSWEKIVFVIFAIVLLVSLGDQWQETPHTRIMEAVICYRYFEKVDPSKLLLSRDQVGPGAIGGVAEMYCKVDAVQSELAMLRGWQSTFDGFPTLILALPFGWAADRFGRKPFVLAGLVSYVLRAAWVELVLWFWQSFPIKAIWFSTFFASIGGGNTVTVTMLFVLLSDVTPEAKRANAFLRVGAFNILASLVMPPFAAWLMKHNPWLPALGGTTLMTLGMLIYLVFPETINFKRNSLPDDELDCTRLETEDPVPPDCKDQTLTGRMRQGIANFRGESAILLNDWRVPALTLPFLLHMLLGTIGGLLMQYLSKKYGLTFADATLLMTVRSGILVLLLFVILPYVSTVMMERYGLSGPRKDLYLVRISLVLIAAGLTLIGLSPNLVAVTISLALASLGLGFALLLRSFLTALVPSHHIARVYSIVSIIDTIGMMVGSPMLAGLFKRGLALGGAWIGLPFYFTALTAVASLLLLLRIRLRKTEEEQSNVDEER